MINRVTLIVAGLLASSAVSAFPEGAEPGYTGGWEQPDCSACHFAGPPQSERSGIELAGLAQQLVPGKTYQLELIVLDPEQQVGGFQLAIRNAGTGASSGEFEPQSGQQQLEADGITYLSHSEPAEASADGEEQRTRWYIHWKAGADQAVEISVAAVAADADASPLGDNVYTLSRKITAD
ncbi:choice-of-anchor V domain-containing protein [Aliidiomarina soli]|uniref:choice-of-anchor V domain-containing protein n=1 Tax=Aliidiomarina soli TaxID=1928574 RepID=UPI000F87FCDB|nr:choice-of-anchor V domain-containing protein [Aliidiomarina soli]